MIDLWPLWIALAAMDWLLLRLTRTTHVWASSSAHTSGPAASPAVAGLGLCPACAPSPPPTAE